MAQPYDRFPLIDGKRAIDPGELFNDISAAGLPTGQFWGRANSITCPAGMEPGSAWFVMTKANADLIDKNTFVNLDWVHENADGFTRLKNYVLCKNVAVGLDGGGNSSAPRLLEFRDKRQVLKLAAIDREYNVRRTTRQGDTGSTDLYYTDSRNGGSDWTWQTMFENVWGNLPSAIRGTAPTLPYVPSREPENFRFHGSAWNAVATILEATQSTLCYDPIDDEFTVERLGATQSGLEEALSALTNAKRKMENESPIEDVNLATCPEKIRFYFPKRMEQDSQLFESDDGGVLVDPYHTIDKTTGLSGAQAGTVLPYRTRFIAEVDADGSTINNASALDTFADELKDKIKERLDRDESFDVFQGIVTDVKPGSEISEVIWRDYGDGYGCVTELRHAPKTIIDAPPVRVHPRMPVGIYLAKVPVSGIPARSGTTPGSATVAIWKIDGGGLTDTGLTETVYNIYALAYTFDASDPYIQVAQDRYGLWFAEDPPESDTGYAKFIGFTISNTTGGLMKANNDQMAATVDYIIQGTTPPLDGNGELIVHDDQEVCPNALAGGSGWAIRNDNLGGGTPYYQIITCNQICRQARAVLDQTMDGHEISVNIRDFFPDDESPEGLDAIEPFRSKAYNPSNHSGRNGFRVRLRWGNYTDPNGIPHQGYIIEEVQHQFFYIPAGWRVSPTKEIEVRWLPVTVETHIADTADLPWEKWLPSKNCT